LILVTIRIRAYQEISLADVSNSFFRRSTPTEQVGEAMLSKNTTRPIQPTVGTFTSNILEGLMVEQAWPLVFIRMDSNLGGINERTKVCITSFRTFGNDDRFTRSGF
jgi:predicted transcriptional regulator